MLFAFIMTPDYRNSINIYFLLQYMLFLHSQRNLTEYIFNTVALLVYNYVCFMYIDVIYIYTNVFTIVIEGKQTL